MAPPRVVSFSELQTARQCPLKHQLSYVERWVKEQELMSPLSKGTAWHMVLEEHYKELKHHQDAAQQLGRDWRDDIVKVRELCEQRVAALIEDQIVPRGGELADLIRWIYAGHLAMWGLDEEWRILAVEHQAVCRLPTPAGRPSQFKLKMKIDLVVGLQVASAKRILVVDHKSCANLPKDKELDLDDQFGLYTWGMRQIGKKVFGQVHDAARTTRLVGEQKAWDGDTDQAYAPGDVQALEDRFKRTRMYRTDDELNQIAIEAYLSAKARYDQQRAANRGGYDSPRHTDPQTCRYLCDFTDPCLAGRKGVDLREYLQARGFQQDHTRH